MSKRLNFAQCTSCHPNEEYVGDDYDVEDDLFEDSLDGSNDEHGLSAEEKKPNEQLQELQAYNLRERNVQLSFNQTKAKARSQRRSAATLRKRLKKNNGEDGVNSITDEVRNSIIYYSLYY